MRQWRLGVTRSRSTYQRPSSNLRLDVVSFIEASAPSMLDKADDPPAPAAVNPCAESVLHGKGDSREEIAAFQSRGLDADFIIGGRERESANRPR